MQFTPFELETYQSKYEHNVRVNLADSSGKSASWRELLKLAGRDADEFLGSLLIYPMVNGTLALRERIAGQYAGADAENVLVTVGASEANALVCSTLLEAGDEVIVISPGYRQVWGTARNMGCMVRELQLRPEDAWRPDIDALARLVNAKTKLISVVNPSNPTGIVFTPDEMARIVKIASRAGVWLHADEVYGGTEFAVAPGASFWGSYERTIIAASLSKAYGLSGLRVGWAVASKAMIEQLWLRHEYAVIATAAPSMALAELALQPAVRAALVAKQRQQAADGHALLADWLAEHAGLVSAVPAQATAIGFVRYHLPHAVSSFEVAEAIRTQADLLVAPGEYLGTDGHLRITLGYEREKVAGALTNIARVLRGMAH